MKMEPPLCSPRTLGRLEEAALEEKPQTLNRWFAAPSFSSSPVCLVVEMGIEGWNEDAKVCARFMPRCVLFPFPINLLVFSLAIYARPRSPFINLIT